MRSVHDHEWLEERLGRALARIDQLEVSVASTQPGSDRWHAATFVLEHALEEINAYKELLATLVDGDIAPLHAPG